MPLLVALGLGVAGFARRASEAHGGQGLEIQVIVPLQKIEYGVYGDVIIIHPKPFSIYLRGTIVRDNLSNFSMGFNVYPGGAVAHSGLFRKMEQQEGVRSS